MRNKSVDVDLLIADYNNNTTLKELAYKYNVTVEGIRYHLIHSGVYQRQRISPSRQKLLDRCKSINTQKYSNKELWEMMKDIYPSFSTFRQTLSALDIPYKKIKEGRPYKDSK